MLLNSCASRISKSACNLPPRPTTIQAYLRNYDDDVDGISRRRVVSRQGSAIHGDVIFRPTSSSQFPSLGEVSSKEYLTGTPTTSQTWIFKASSIENCNLLTPTTKYRVNCTPVQHRSKSLHVFDFTRCNEPFNADEGTVQCYTRNPSARKFDSNQNLRVAGRSRSVGSGLGGHYDDVGQRSNSAIFPQKQAYEQAEGLSVYDRLPATPYDELNITTGKPRFYYESSLNQRPPRNSILDLRRRIAPLNKSVSENFLKTLSSLQHKDDSSFSLRPTKTDTKIYLPPRVLPSVFSYEQDRVTKIPGPGISPYDLRHSRKNPILSRRISESLEDFSRRGQSTRGSTSTANIVKQRSASLPSRYSGDWNSMSSPTTSKWFGKRKSKCSLFEYEKGKRNMKCKSRSSFVDFGILGSYITEDGSSLMEHMANQISQLWLAGGSRMSLQNLCYGANDPWGVSGETPLKECTTSENQPQQSEPVVCGDRKSKLVSARGILPPMEIAGGSPFPLIRINKGQRGGTDRIKKKSPEEILLDRWLKINQAVSQPVKTSSEYVMTGNSRSPIIKKVTRKAYDKEIEEAFLTAKSTININASQSRVGLLGKSIKLKPEFKNIEFPRTKKQGVRPFKLPEEIQATAHEIHTPSKYSIFPPYSEQSKKKSKSFSQQPPKGIGDKGKFKQHEPPTSIRPQINKPKNTIRRIESSATLRQNLASQTHISNRATLQKKTTKFETDNGAWATRNTMMQSKPLHGYSTGQTLGDKKFNSKDDKKQNLLSELRKEQIMESQKKPQESKNSGGYDTSRTAGRLPITEASHMRLVNLAQTQPKEVPWKVKRQSKKNIEGFKLPK